MTDCPKPQSDHDLLHEIAVIVKRVDTGLSNHLSHHQTIAVALVGVAATGIVAAIIAILFR